MAFGVVAFDAALLRQYPRLHSNTSLLYGVDFQKFLRVFQSSTCEWGAQ